MPVGACLLPFSPLLSYVQNYPSALRPRFVARRRISARRRARVAHLREAPQRAGHHDRRCRLRRLLVLRRQTGAHPQHRPPRRQRRAFHRCPCLRLHFHTLPLRIPHGRIPLPPPRHRCGRRQRRHGHPPRTVHPGRSFQSRRLHHRRHRQVASRSRQPHRTAGLERTDRPHSRRSRVRLQLHHGRHRRPRALCVHRKRTRAQLRCLGPHPSELPQQFLR